MENNTKNIPKKNTSIKQLIFFIVQLVLPTILFLVFATIVKMQISNASDSFKPVYVLLVIFAGIGTIIATLAFLFVNYVKHFKKTQ